MIRKVTDDQSTRTSVHKQIQSRDGIQSSRRSICSKKVGVPRLFVRKNEAKYRGKELL